MDHREHIRKRPGMYFGDNGPRGVVHVVNELLSNGIDIFLRGEATQIGLSIAGDTITYTDDGPGLPFDSPCPDNLSLAEHHLTRFHDTRTADGHAPHIHLMSLGFGLVCVNAVSEFFEVKSCRSGRLWMQQFRRGIPSGPPTVTASSANSGTTLSFRLDPEVFAVRLPDPFLMRRLLFEAAHLFPGLVVNFDHETFHAPLGLAALAHLSLSANSLGLAPPPFAFNAKTDDLHLIVGVAGNYSALTYFRSWANGSATPAHGHHLDGLKDALRAVDLSPEVAMIHVIFQKPEFAGPTRNQLNNPHVRKPIRECLKPALSRWREDQTPT